MRGAGSQGKKTLPKDRKVKAPRNGARLEIYGSVRSTDGFDALIRRKRAEQREQGMLAKENVAWQTKRANDKKR